MALAPETEVVMGSDYHFAGYNWRGPAGMAPNRAPIAIGRAYVVLVTGLFIIAITKPTAMSTIPIQVR